MDLLGDLKMEDLNLNYLKDTIFERFFKDYNDFYFFN